MRQKLRRIFENLNLTKSQIKVLLTCFENNPITAAELARKSHLEKSTVYLALKELSEQGLIEQEIKKGGKVFRPISAQRLKSIVANRQRKFRRLELEVEELIPELVKFSSAKLPGKPKVKLYEGEKAQQIIAEEVRRKGKVRYTIGSDA